MQVFKQSVFFCAPILLGWALLHSAHAVDGGVTKPVLAAADFEPFDEKRAALGQLLFYDPILSGNRNISCGTCHHHDHASTDGLPLGIGTGGTGLSTQRKVGSGHLTIERRVPRNAPALFNLGAKEVRVLFHDGRLERGEMFENGFNSPAEEWLPEGLTSLAAVQAMFPVTSETEMAGEPEDNEIAGAANDRIDNVWPIIAERVRQPYKDLMIAAYDDVKTAGDITMVHVANALGDFINSEWRSYESPYDLGTMTPAQKRGEAVFFGKGGCASCHSGALFTDQEFHALALPQFGPGRTRRFDPIPRDVGRMGETDLLEDAYRFRTPTLRNVAETGPYGHNGAYPTLEGIIRHHLNPIEARENWTQDMVALAPHEKLSLVDFVIQEDSREMARQAAKIDIVPTVLTDNEIDDLVVFMQALTDDKRLGGRLGRPDSVPSGLPID